MENNGTKKLLSDLHGKISKIETKLQEQNNLLQQIIDNSLQNQYLINHGILGFKEMVLDKFEKQSKENKINRLYSIFMHDKDLTHPHKKILSYLLEQFNLGKNCFDSINFSKIVRNCKLGKNKAKEYLDLLTKKGFIEKQNDGYRVWYCISSCLLPKE